jgi:hypothetical protein
MTTEICFIVAIQICLKDSVAYALHGATTQSGCTRCPTYQMRHSVSGTHSESEPTPSLARRAGGYVCCSVLVGCFRSHWLTGCFILTMPVSFLLADFFHTSCFILLGSLMLSHDAVLWCCLVLSRDAVSWCCLMMLSHDVVSWCCLMVLSHDAVSWCCLMMLSHDAVSW